MRLSQLPPILTVERAGKLLGMSRSAAYRAVDRGDIPALRMGGRWLVPTAALLRLIGVAEAVDEAIVAFADGSAS